MASPRPLLGQNERTLCEASFFVPGRIKPCPSWVTKVAHAMHKTLVPRIMWRRPLRNVFHSLMRLKRWERPEVEGGAPTGEWRRAGRASRPRSNAGEDRRVRRRAPRRCVEREVWQQQQLEAQQERQRQLC